MRALCIFLWISCSLYAEGDIQTLKGRVVSVQKYNLVNKPVPYVQFLFNSNGTDYTVEIGPEWYIDEQSLILIPREEVEVTGSISTISDRKIIIASRLKKGDVEFHLLHNTFVDDK